MSNARVKITTEIISKLYIDFRFAQCYDLNSLEITKLQISMDFNTY